MLLTSSGLRPGMLLNILQGTGQPTTKNYPVSNISTACETLLQDLSVNSFNDTNLTEVLRVK